ncbi:hypothetical protein ACJJIL_12335 [Microbulbifer sp. EKSA005]|uniref:hypothetical protein n=1 Tax=Microbulbifer sp. EKSA005 TaxID=3243364 RepID=UPI004042B1FE
MSDIEKWNELKSRIRVGDEIEANVFRVESYGVLVDIGFQIEDDYKFSGIIDIALTPKPGIKALPKKLEDWPSVGEQVTCVVLAYRERNFEVDLGIKT